jgi:hypothetical protein
MLPDQICKGGIICATNLDKGCKTDEILSCFGRCAGDRAFYLITHGVVYWYAGYGTNDRTIL